MFLTAERSWRGIFKRDCCCLSDSMPMFRARLPHSIWTYVEGNLCLDSVHYNVMHFTECRIRAQITKGKHTAIFIYLFKKKIFKMSSHLVYIQFPLARRGWHEPCRYCSWPWRTGHDGYGKRNGVWDAFVFLKNEKHIGWTDEEKQQLMFICSLFLLSYQLVHVMWCHYQHCFG